MNLETRIASLKTYTYTITMALGLVLAMMACNTTGANSAGTSAADASAGTSNPAWLNQLIQELEEAESSNPPAKIYSYTYDYQTVYYLTSRCCDIPSKLYDAKGNVYCEPDGGITGKGDGRCSDFMERRENEKLIWEDKRESK